MNHLREADVILYSHLNDIKALDEGLPYSKLVCSIITVTNSQD